MSALLMWDSDRIRDKSVQSECRIRLAYRHIRSQVADAGWIQRSCTRSSTLILMLAFERDKVHKTYESDIEIINHKNSRATQQS